MSIPAELLTFLREVAERIELGDEAATLESDDLLQAECAYGGLLDPEQRIYSFRYFPGEETEVTWDFQVTAEAIGAIAEDRLTHLPMCRCENPLCERRHATVDQPCPDCDDELDPIDAVGLCRRQFPNASDDAVASLARLRRLAHAVSKYERIHKYYPPPCLVDELGQPLHSWRTLILPFLGYAELFSEINLAEPWDSPANQRHWNRMPDDYRCDLPGVDSLTTGIIAVTGSNTMWPMDAHRTVNDVTTGLSYTILLIESGGHLSHWMRPQVVTVEQVCDEWRSGTLSSGQIPGQLHAALVDGNVAILTNENEVNALRNWFETL